MATPKCLILRTAGTNCDEETQHAWNLAGALADRLHVNRLIERPALLGDYQILTLAGGFSYGDDVAAGKILANQLKAHLSHELHGFLAADKLILGICNGFQVLVKAGLLPGPPIGPDRVTLCWNDSARFEDRWVRLAVTTPRCVFLEGIEQIELPVAHAEGRLAARDESTLEMLDAGNHVALRFVDAAGNLAGYPQNPNGSALGAAGLTDVSGRILGLMPHPERFVHRTHHPQWTRLPERREPDGLKLFRNAVRFFKG